MYNILYKSYKVLLIKTTKTRIKCGHCSVFTSTRSYAKN